MIVASQGGARSPTPNYFDGEGAMPISSLGQTNWSQMILGLKKAAGLDCFALFSLIVFSTIQSEAHETVSHEGRRSVPQYSSTSIENERPLGESALLRHFGVLRDPLAGRFLSPAEIAARREWRR